MKKTYPVKAVTALMMASSVAFALAGPRDEIASVALDQFESTLEQIVRTGSPEAAKEAISALARSRSPRFPRARDLLAQSPHKQVKLALVRSIGVADDSSVSARRILSRSLVAGDRELAAAAAFTLRHSSTHVPFRDVWRRDESLSFWTDYDRNQFALVALFDRIGDAAPWKDQAWDAVSRNIQLLLLARAGTEEALSRLLTTIERNPDLSVPSLPAAEHADLATFRKLLHHDRLEIRRFASSSLVHAGDKVHLDMLRELLARFEELPTEQQKHELEAVALEEALGVLDVDSLRRVSGLVFGRWLFLAEQQLRERGEPLSFATLTQRREALAASAKLTAGKPTDNRSREEIYRYLRQSYSSLIRALIVERRYQELLPILQEALRLPDQLHATSLETALARAPEFLAELPEDVSSACHTAIRRAHVIRGDDWTKGSAALGLLGLLTRGEDAERLWEEFKAADRPLADRYALYPMVRGFSKRSDELRTILSNHKHRSWLRPDYTRPRTPATAVPSQLIPNPRPEACSGEWNPLRVEATQERVWRARRSLAIALEAVFPDFDDQAFARMFLGLRGAGPIELRPERLLDFEQSTYYDSAVETLTRERERERTPSASQLPSNWSQLQIAAWEMTFRMKFKSDAVAPESLPGPQFSSDERQWLRDLLAKTRSEHFEDLVRRTTAPDGIIACRFGPEATPSLVPELRGTFVASALDYLPELRGLLSSPNRVHRHEAAWALWQRAQDQDAVRLLLQDATTGDSAVKTSAFDILRRIHYAPAAPKFSLLLDESAPELRQVGLWGVRDFNRLPPIRRLLELTQDEDASVSETAIETLGSAGTSESRDLLLEMLREDPRRARKAAWALTKYRRDEDINAFMSRLTRRSHSPQEKQFLFYIVRSAVGELLTRPPWRTEGLNEPPTRDLVQHWQEWWRNRRSEPPTERFKSRIDVLVGDLLHASEERQRYAAWALYTLLPSPVRYKIDLLDSDPELENLQAVQDWWRDHRQLELAELMTSHAPELGVQGSPNKWILLYAFEPSNARNELMLELYRSVGRPFRQRESAAHRMLVAYERVDHGDPALVACELRARVLEDWSAWANAPAEGVETGIAEHTTVQFPLASESANARR